MPNKNQVGLTLIELIIAVVLSSAVLGILGQIFMAVKSSYDIQNELYTIQENARIAIELIDKNIRSAGFLGCATLTNHYPLTNTTEFPISIDNKIQIEPGIIRTWHAEDKKFQLLSDMDDLSELRLKKINSLKNKVILVITDCKTTDIFSIDSNEKHNNYLLIKTNKPLSKLYKNNAELYLLVTDSFHVRSRSMLLKNNTEIAERIQQLQSEKDKNGLQIILTLSTKHFKKKWYSYVAFQQ